MKKVLVVEDELGLSKSLNIKLVKEGFQVIQAGDGERGLEMAKKEKPDLILLDIGLPKMTGLELLEALRKEPGGNEVKVIMMTNFEPDEKIAKQMVTDNPLYYFVKSNTNIEDLMTKIKEALY